MKIKIDHLAKIGRNNGKFPISSYLDVLSKISYIVIVLSYFFGFIISNCYLNFLGYNEVDFLQVKYFSTGLSFLAVNIIIFHFLFLLYGFKKDKVKNSMNFLFSGLILWSMTLAIGIIFWDSWKMNLSIVIYLILYIFLLFLLREIFKFKPNSISIFFIHNYVNLCIFVKYLPFNP